MPDTIREILPLALAVAVSPFPIVPAILLLFTGRPLGTAGSYLATYFAGLAAIVAVFTALAAVIETRDYPPAWASWTRIIVGVLLVVVGVRQWLSRGSSAKEPAWLANLAETTPAAAARLGVLLSVANPKVLLLAGAAGLTIGAAELPPGQSAVAILVFSLIGSVSVATPLVAYAIFGERARRPLGTARDWLQRNNAAVTAVVLVVIGAYLLKEGIGGR